MLKKVIFSVLAFISISTEVLAYEIKAQVESNQVVAGEVFNLDLVYNGNDIDDGQPDLSLLQKDFRIYSISSSAQSSFIKGKGQINRVWTVGLMPRHEGKVTIPSLNIGQFSSNPLEIDVLPIGSSLQKVENKKISNNESVNTDKFMLDFKIDNSNPFVGQEVNAELIITDNVGLQINSEPVWDTNADWVIKSLKSPTVDNDGNGRRIIKFYYALFPQKSGLQTLPQAQIDGYYLSFNENSRSAKNGLWEFLDISFNSMFGTQKPVLLTTQAQEINVRAVPVNYGSAKWIPAEKLALQAKWNETKPVFKVGETVSREIILTAQGVDEAQLPEFDFPTDSTLKQYPENPQYSSVVNKDKVISQSSTRIVYIPQKSGELIFPEIKLRWYNVIKNSIETAIIPSQKVYVEENGLKAASGVTSETDISVEKPNVSHKTSAKNKTNVVTESFSMIKIIFAVAAAFLAGIILSYLLFTRKFNRSNKVYVRDILKSIEEDIKNGDMRALQSHLVAWGNAFYTHFDIRNINDVAQHLGNEDFSQQMALLNNILYGQSKEKINGLLILKILRNASPQGKDKNKKEPLPQLYK